MTQRNTLGNYTEKMAASRDGWYNRHMRILALEPYYGGSHRAFLDGWVLRSRQEWTLLTLPATKWKWRMRHSAMSFAALVTEACQQGSHWDMVFCSDMLNLAEFAGLAPEQVRALPRLAYFHENQITYPVREESERDYHFSFSNLATALAADRVWFNSQFHLLEFLEGLESFLRRMPDHQPLEAVERIRGKSFIRPPLVDSFPPMKSRDEGPMHILWAARWEFDKDPDTFFEALELLGSMGTDFRVSVIGGGNAREILRVFGKARKHLTGRIVNWGYIESRDAYRMALREADVIVSTAIHEFFGLSVVEAVAAGVYPLVPKRLAYPEVLGDAERPEKDSFFYEGGARELAGRLHELAVRTEAGDLWQGDVDRGSRAVEKFMWDHELSARDDELEKIAAGD